MENAHSAAGGFPRMFFFFFVFFVSFQIGPQLQLMLILISPSQYRFGKEVDRLVRFMTSLPFRADLI